VLLLIQRLLIEIGRFLRKSCCCHIHLLALRIVIHRIITLHLVDFIIILSIDDSQLFRVDVLVVVEESLEMIFFLLLKYAGVCLCLLLLLLIIHGHNLLVNLFLMQLS